MKAAVAAVCAGVAGVAAGFTTGDDPPPAAVTVVETVTTTTTKRVATRWQGRPIRWWARRTAQARRDANARALTIVRLRAQSRRLVHNAHMALAQPSVWDRIASCESGGRWDYNGPSGFDGGVQFHPGTWAAYRPAGYPSFAYQATREQQILVAELVLASQGWGAWPACSSKLGLR